MPVVVDAVGGPRALRLCAFGLAILGTLATPGCREHDASATIEDPTGAFVAHPVSGDHVRIFYRVGDAEFPGPLVLSPPDFRGVPSLDHALGPLFENAGPRRAELVAELRKGRGEDAVVDLLVLASYVDDPAWEGAKGTLSREGRRRLGSGLVRGLERGRPGIVLRRAVESVDLEAAFLGPLIDARLHDEAAAQAEPRALAVLLRSVLATDPPAAAKASCAILKRRKEQGAVRIDATSPSSVLLEAATLSLAQTGEACAASELEALLLADPCDPSLRCRDAAPCTAAELSDAVRADVARRPLDVLEAPTGRPGLFALACLSAKGRVPDRFVAAAARCEDRR